MAGVYLAEPLVANWPGTERNHTHSRVVLVRESGTMSESALDQLRSIVLALPEVSERVSHGAPCFFVRTTSALCYFHDDHRGDGRVSLWCPAPPGIQDEMVDSEPERFFRPPTSARGTFSGWLGVYLDGRGHDGVDWHEVAMLLEDAFRVVAPAALVAQLDGNDDERKSSTC